MKEVSFNPLYYNLWFSLCGLMLNVVVMVVYNAESTLNTRRSDIFRKMTLCISITELLTLIHCIWLKSSFLRGIIPVSLETWVTLAEKLAIFTVPLLIILYVMELYNVRPDNRERTLIIVLPQTVTYLVIISALFTPLFFRFDSNAQMVYRYPQACLVFINAAVFLTYAGYLNFRFGYTISREKKAALWFYLFLAGC